MFQFSLQLYFTSEVYISFNRFSSLILYNLKALSRFVHTYLFFYIFLVITYMN